MTTAVKNYQLVFVNTTGKTHDLTVMLCEAEIDHTTEYDTIRDVELIKVEENDMDRATEIVNQYTSAIYRQLKQLLAQI